MRNTSLYAKNNVMMRYIVRFGVAMAVCVMLTGQAVVAAQDEVPAEGQEQVSEPAPVEPTPEPPAPTAIPPTAVPPTEIPAPTAIPATEAPIATEAPADATEVPLTPTEEPTVSPTETPALESTLTYTLIERADCGPVADQPASIASGGSRDYQCTDRLTLRGSNLIPADIAVTWTTRAEVEGGWTVQLLPPINDEDAPAEWSTEGLAETDFAFVQTNPAGPGIEASDIDTTIEVTYRLRVHRAACAEAAQAVWLTHDAVVQSPEAEATHEPVLTTPREPLRITPDLAPIAQPAVAFDGALNFGEIGLTASGLSNAIPTGTLAVVVTDLDQSCGDWTVSVAASDLTDDAGNALLDSRLVVVAVNDAAIADGGCDLGPGCSLATFAGGQDAPASQTLVLTVELRMPEQASIGAFDTTLDASLSQAGTPDALERPQQARLAES